MGIDSRCMCARVPGRAWLAAGMLLLVSCDDIAGPRERSSDLHAGAALVDSRNGGIQGFYFLPPLAPSLAYSGEFDAGRAPVVDICILNGGGGCGPTVARFTMTTGQGAARVRLDQASQQYIVQWNTDKSIHSTNAVYRVRVFDDGTELGHADVKLMNTGSEAKSLAGGLVGVMLGATLPVKFRIERRLSAAAVRLEIHPGAFLLPGSGTTQELEVWAFDANGNRTSPGAVTWSSSKSQVLTVSPDGLATALADAGSSHVTVTSGGLVSPPVIGLVATVGAGSLLVDDENVLPAPSTGAALLRIPADLQAPSEPNVIVPVDINAPYVPGWLYKVYLQGLNPAVGQLVIGTGESPIGGRVVSTSPYADGVEVTLSLVPLDELLPGLSIDETLSLAYVPIEVPAAIAAEYEVTRGARGRTLFTPRSAHTFGFAKQLGRRAVPPSFSAVEPPSFPLGPFKCEVESGVQAAPNLSALPDISIDPSISLDIRYTPTNGLERLVVAGGLNSIINFSPVFPVGFEEKLTCKVKLGSITLPIGGPLALFIGGQVPLGVGVELAGKVSVGGFGFNSSAAAGVTVLLGYDRSASSGVVADLAGNATGTFNPVLPALIDLREELSLSLFGWAELAIGNRFFEALQFEAFKAKAGLKQSLSLAPPLNQVSDAAYASGFKLSFDVEIGTGESIAAIAGLLNVPLLELKSEFSQPLAESPKIQSFTISPASVRASSSSSEGDPAHFIISVDPVTYVAFNSLDSIEFFRKKAGTGGGFVLEKLPAPCGQIATPNAQSAFTCEMTLPETWIGDQTVYAFGKTRMFGIPLPVLMELGPDAKAVLTVEGPSGASVLITPEGAVVAPGQSQQFSATVTGITNQDVVWSATGGVISSTGLYVAGATPGAYAVTATSVADNSVTATVGVSVGDAPRVTYVRNGTWVRLNLYASAIADNGAGAGEEYVFDQSTPVDPSARNVEGSYSESGTAVDGGGASASASGTATVNMNLSFAGDTAFAGGTASARQNVQASIQNFRTDTRGGASAQGYSDFSVAFVPQEPAVLRLRIEGQSACGSASADGTLAVGIWVDLHGANVDGLNGLKWVDSVSVDRVIPLTTGVTYDLRVISNCPIAQPLSGTGLFDVSFSFERASAALSVGATRERRTGIVRSRQGPHLSR